MSNQIIQNTAPELDAQIVGNRLTFRNVDTRQTVDSRHRYIATGLFALLIKSITAA